MTTTHLYSGIDDGQKPSSRVLNPPGGKSNNIFGGAEEPSPPKMREQAPKQVTIMDQNQNSGGASEPPRQVQQTQGQQANPSRKDGGPPPFASFQESGKPSAPTQFDRCDGGSQNDADFRCYSAAAYRNAVQQNEAVRTRARGQASSGFNPITHEEQNASPFAEYEQARNPAEQQSRPNQKRNGKLQQEQNTGKVSYNPITGEEYPEDYGQKNKTEKCEEEDEEEESIEVKKEENTSSNAVATATTVTAASNEPHLGAPKKTAVKVRQPPGGASSGLW